MSMELPVQREMRRSETREVMTQASVVYDCSSDHWVHVSGGYVISARAGVCHRLNSHYIHYFCISIVQFAILVYDCTEQIYTVHTATFMFACSTVVSHCSYFRYYLFFFVSLHFRATNLFTFCTWTIRNLYSVILLFFGKRCSFTCTLLSCIKRKYC